MPSKEELIKQLGVTDTFDYALPLPWVHSTADKVSNYGYSRKDVIDGFVWMFDEGNTTFGRPFPLTDKAKNILKFINLQHTPGPWKVHVHEDMIDVIGDSIIIHSAMELSENLENISNAYLIAAAPDLLVALEETLGCLIDWVEIAEEHDKRDHNYEAIEKAKAALAKAKGA